MSMFAVVVAHSLHPDTLAEATAVAGATNKDVVVVDPLVEATTPVATVATTTPLPQRYY